ncbi:LytR/AlgR family response regulator transcription factor [Microbacterium sp.]|uniref:LytR/AlgR family response regulator transcription factor n=1 Tax=Microbacterium sp. TaxID=51671 RepID=UPI002810A63D|nr:LytTR family DNA-binding domain-containing protein [Microbacterium sp.]
MIDVLIADDEPPALAELVALLRADARIGAIHAASSGAEALRMLSVEAVDAVFLDIHMPGVSGFDLARALDRFAERPAVVFVTADEAGAVEAFELQALDYVLKPVRPERLRRTVDRVVAERRGRESGEDAEGQTVPVPIGQSVRLVRRDDVRWVKAEGDYSRLWTEAGDSHLVRIPISELEERWAAAGFVRIHRSYLVHADAVTEVRLSGSLPVVGLAEIELPVSRRLIPAVRSRLVKAERR